MNYIADLRNTGTRVVVEACTTNTIMLVRNPAFLIAHTGLTIFFLVCNSPGRKAMLICSLLNIPDANAACNCKNSRNFMPFQVQKTSGNIENGAPLCRTPRHCARQSNRSRNQTSQGNISMIGEKTNRNETKSTRKTSC